MNNIYIEKKKNQKYNYLVTWSVNNHIYTQFFKTLKDIFEYIGKWENTNIIYDWRE